MKTNPTIETASVSLIADYLCHLYSITENHAASDYSILWHNLWDKIMSEGIYDIIMKRFDNFDWDPADDYESYKSGCADFIASFNDFAASIISSRVTFISFSIWSSGEYDVPIYA